MASVGGGDDGWSRACLARYAAQSSELGGCLLRRGAMLDATSAPDDDTSGGRVLGIGVQTGTRAAHRQGVKVVVLRSDVRYELGALLPKDGARVEEDLVRLLDAE